MKCDDDTEDTNVNGDDIVSVKVYTREAISIIRTQNKDWLSYRR